MVRRALLTGLLSLLLSTSSGVVCASTPLAHEPPIQKEDINHFFSVLYTVHRFYIQPTSYRELMDKALAGMLLKLDPHSEYLDKAGLSALRATISDHYVGIGVELTHVKGLPTVAAVLDGSPAQHAGLAVDDTIIKVGDTLLSNLSLTEAVKLIKGKANTTVTLTVIRKGVDHSLSFTVKRQTVHYNAVTITEPKPGYIAIRISVFQKGLRQKVASHLKAIQKKERINGVMLDLRSNPGGLLDEANDLIGLFLTDKQLKRYHGESVSIKGRYPQANEQFIATGSSLLKGVPMVLLIDHSSASAAEIVAGAMQDYKRAIVIGQRSFGKGSVQTLLPVSKDSAVKLTTSLYYTPAGREIQAAGIEPDIILPKLSVTLKKEDDLDSINEANFQHYLHGHHAKTKHAAHTDSLAKTDYGLFQALIILQGMHIVDDTH